MSNSSLRTLAVTAIALFMIAPVASFAAAQDPLPNELPTAALLVPGAAIANSVVTLDGAASSDIDGSIASYEFTIDGVAQPSQATPTLDHTFTTLGTHTVGLVVIDDLGAASAPASASIDIVLGPLVRIDVTGPATLESGVTADYTSTGYDALDNVLFTRLVSVTGPAALGPLQVCDSQDGVTGCLDIEIVIGALHHITVTASQGTVNIGRLAQITARGFDINNNEHVGMVFTFTTTRGAITSTGGFSSASPGLATIRATSGAITGSVVLRVTPTLPTTITVDDAQIVDTVMNGVSGTAHVGYIGGAAIEGATVKIFFTDPLGSTSDVLELVTDSAGNVAFSSGGQIIPGEYVVSVASTAGPNYGSAVDTYIVYVADPDVI